jgi:hypothetical protein
MAARIIQKLNNNSQRILKITSKKASLAPILSQQSAEYRAGAKTTMEVDQTTACVAIDETER